MSRFPGDVRLTLWLIKWIGLPLIIAGIIYRLLQWAGVVGWMRF